jgi:hypothetical protein
MNEVSSFFGISKETLVLIALYAGGAVWILSLAMFSKLGKKKRF